MSLPANAAFLSSTGNQSPFWYSSIRCFCDPFDSLSDPFYVLFKDTWDQPLQKPSPHLGSLLDFLPEFVLELWPPCRWHDGHCEYYCQVARTYPIFPIIPNPNFSHLPEEVNNVCMFTYISNNDIFIYNNGHNKQYSSLKHNQHKCRPSFIRAEISSAKFLSTWNTWTNHLKKISKYTWLANRSLRILGKCTILRI